MSGRARRTVVRARATTAERLELRRRRRSPAACSSSQRRPPGPLGPAVDVTRRHRMPQGPGDVAALLQHAARPFVGRREPAAPNAPSRLRRKAPNRWWYRYQPTRCPTGTTNRFAVGTRSSSAPDSSLPVTAKHSSASNASSTEVSTRNSATSDGRLDRTSLRRKSLTARSVLAKASRNSSPAAPPWSAMAASWAPAGQPSVSSCRRTSSLGVRGCRGKRRSRTAPPPRIGGHRHGAREGRRASGAETATSGDRTVCRRRTGTARAGRPQTPPAWQERAGQVQIVDEDHARRVDRGELVGYGNGGVVGVGAVPLQEHERIVGHTRPPLGDRRQQAGHEPRRLSIGRVARQPGEPIAVLIRPRRQRCRLSVAGRRRHEREPMLRVEARRQLRSRQQGPSRRRDRKLGRGYDVLDDPSDPARVTAQTTSATSPIRWSLAVHGGVDDELGVDEVIVAVGTGFHLEPGDRAGEGVVASGVVLRHG